MTLITAISNYAAAYRDYQIARGRTCNIDIATQYATKDVLNMVKGMKENHAVFVVNDEISYLKRG